MVDHKKKRDRHRSGHSGGKTYSEKYFARKHHLSLADARSILQRAGGSKERANQLANEERKVYPLGKLPDAGADSLGPGPGTPRIK